MSEPVNDGNSTAGAGPASGEEHTMSGLDRAYRAYGHVKLAGALLSGLAIFGMMVLIVADVVSRNWLGGSISGSFEIVENYFMPVAVFPALAYVYGSGVLPRMDLLMHRAKRGLQDSVVYLLLVLEVVLFSVMAWYSWGYATTGMERESAFPAGGELYPLWPLYFLVPLGFVMVVVETLFVLVNNVTGDRVRFAMHDEGEVEAL